MACVRMRKSLPHSDPSGGVAAESIDRRSPQETNADGTLGEHDAAGRSKRHREDERIARFTTQKNRVLLAYLADHLRQMHTREHLIALLRPDATPASGLMSRITAV
jgi:hypothetical protein